MKPDYIETHLAKHEYTEGPAATNNFERVATAVFRAKKTVAQAQPKKRASAKKSGKGED